MLEMVRMWGGWAVIVLLYIELDDKLLKEGVGGSVLLCLELHDKL